MFVPPGRYGRTVRRRIPASGFAQLWLPNITRNRIRRYYSQPRSKQADLKKVIFVAHINCARGQVAEQRVGYGTQSWASGSLNVLFCVESMQSKRVQGRNARCAHVQMRLVGRIRTVKVVRSRANIRLRLRNLGRASVVGIFRPARNAAAPQAAVQGRAQN